MGGGTGARRVLVGGIALVGLAAAVGLASRAHAPVGGGHPRSLSGHILLEYVLLIFAALAVVVVPFAFYLFVAGRDQEEALPPRRNWMLSLLLTMTAVAALSLILLTSGWFHKHFGSGGLARPITSISHGSSRAAQAVRFDWGPVIVVAVLAAAGLAVGAYFLLRAIRGEALPRPEHVSAELAVALDRTIADLRAEPDPRRAVIAAYAQMERALARARLPRRPAEAPREYLGRVLPEVGAGAASVERLTALFERAKFSPHAIDAEMKDEAIAALEALRDELRSGT